MNLVHTLYAIYYKGMPKNSEYLASNSKFVFKISKSKCLPKLCNKIANI